MGRFRIVIEGQGQHSPPPALDESGDADAIAKGAVSQLQAAGATVTAAVFEHWPGEPQFVEENMLAMPEGAEQGEAAATPMG